MIGVILKDLNQSQLNYEIFSQAYEMNNFFGVLRNISKNFMPLRFPIVNYSKLFSGYLDDSYTLVATDLDSALTLFQTKNKARKIFYVWELEFLKDKNFDLNRNIYNCLELYTRSESYKQAIENYANTEVKVSDFNLEKLCQI